MLEPLAGRLAGACMRFLMSFHIFPLSFHAAASPFCSVATTHICVCHLLDSSLFGFLGVTVLILLSPWNTTYLSVDTSLVLHGGSSKRLAPPLLVSSRTWMQTRTSMQHHDDYRVICEMLLMADACRCRHLHECECLLYLRKHIGYHVRRNKGMYPATATG